MIRLTPDEKGAEITTTDGSIVFYAFKEEIQAAIAALTQEEIAPGVRCTRLDFSNEATEHNIVSQIILHRLYLHN